MIQKKFEKYIKDYDQHCRKIESSTLIDIHETVGEKHKRIKRLESNYADWFEYYFPSYAKVKCASFHKKMARILFDNDRCNLLAEIYRSGAKSVHLDMGIPMFLYVHKKMKFMLLVGQTADKAKKLISDIQVQMQFNQRFINDYGRKFKFGDWSNGDFTTTDGVKFTALGFGQSPRGIRELAERPDYIVIDDIDTKQRCNNDRLSRKALEWVWEDLQGTFEQGAKVRRFIVANNNFHKNTIINQLKKQYNATNKKRKDSGKPLHNFVLTVKAVKDLKTFEPTWPEKADAQYWKDFFEDTPLRSFMREYMHKHIQDGSIFKHEYIHYKQRLKLSSYDALVIYGDLSYKDAGDYKALVFLGKKGREYHLLTCYVRQGSRTDAAKWLYDLYEDWNLAKYNVRYLIEGLFAMDEFVNDFDTEGDERGYYIPVVSDDETKGNKFDRIESMEGFWLRKMVFINKLLEEDPDVMEFIEQLLAFEKGSTSNDDGPDAFQSALVKLNAITYEAKFEPILTTLSEHINNDKNRF